MATPQRGEVWLVDLGLAAKVRPALVISVPAGDTDRALVTLVPHTTSVRGSRFRSPCSRTVPAPWCIRRADLVTVPFVKLIRRLGHVHPIQLAQVEQGVRAWLGFPSAG